LVPGEVKTVGVQDLNVVAIDAKGRGRLKKRERGVDTAHVAVFVPFLADDGQALDSGRVDEQDAKLHELSYPS
jgi:hypothetical protein